MLKLINLDDIDENDIRLVIKQKLKSLGILDVTMQTPIPGPIVTGYPLTVRTTPISKIVNKGEDIALACKVDSVDIRRIHGEIVIFVPNQDRKIVDFKTSLFWYLQDEKVTKMQLPILLGTDFRGNNAAIDLAIQPHILIAGSTGSGKSVLQSSIIGSLSMLLPSEELELVLVDTKQLDLVHFENLPQVRTVVKTIDDWYPIINGIIAEVDIRNSMMSRIGARNIREYNEKAEQKLSYVILMIDELADLMARDKDKRAGDREFPESKVDLALGRLTQIARASGIHVIACTQRSSTKVVYGDLKANFTTRIALKLPSQIDSRTILDEGGAENLLGKGDMLIKTQDSDELRRFHSPFVRLEDIDAVLNHREMILQTIKRPRLA